jgi:CheY-like chemotaxis protein
MTELHSMPKLVLVATHDDWIGRSVASVLERDGYTVLRTDGGRRALELARRVNPDAILMEDALGDISGSEVCRALRDDPLFDHATPVFITAAAPVAHVVRRTAYQAGAWEYLSQPLDVEALLGKLRTFTRARRELAQARTELFIDPITGLYSTFGLQHWAQHLGALASRRHEPFACVAVMPDASVEDRASPSGEPAPEVLNYLADVCRAHSRRSDIIGYMGQWQFLILAPETDSSGVMGFVGRLRTVLGKSLASTTPRPFSAPLLAGYCAVHDFATATLEPEELLRRAETALDYARGVGQQDGAFSFDELPVS